MNKGECFVDIMEAYECVHHAMFYDEITQEVFQEESDEFKRGALWGMNWALCHIFTYCPSYILNDKEKNHESKANC